MVPPQCGLLGIVSLQEKETRSACHGLGKSWVRSGHVRIDADLVHFHSRWRKESREILSSGWVVDALPSVFALLSLRDSSINQMEARHSPAGLWVVSSLQGLIACRRAAELGTVEKTIHCPVFSALGEPQAHGDRLKTGPSLGGFGRPCLMV